MMELWGAITREPGRLAVLSIYYRRADAPPEERTRVVLDSVVFPDIEAARKHLHDVAHKWRTCFDG